MYMTQASTVRINKRILRNKKQTANTNKKHIHEINTTYARSALPTTNMYVVWSKSFRPDIQNPRQMENALKDI